MIIFRTPKGWTGPKFVDGKPVEGTWRAHQVPLADFGDARHVRQLEEWMKSYRPHELFDAHGKFREELAALAPTGHRRQSGGAAAPAANGFDGLAAAPPAIAVTASGRRCREYCKKKSPARVRRCCTKG
jgi:phosphoketolase